MAMEKLKPLTPTNSLNRRLLWFCLFMCLGGAALVCIGGKAALKAWQARDWPAVSCVIDNSGINSSYKPGHDLVYAFFVAYHYSFNGQDYHSDSVGFDPPGEMDLKSAGALSNRFARGAHATCWVDPQNPTDAVLDRSVSRRDLFATIGGVAMVLASFAGVMVARSGRRRSSLRGGR
jgi:hypothetical protein